jgi:hypothetical protein
MSNQQKSKSPSAASQGKPCTAEKAYTVAITVLQHLVIARRHDEAISIADSSMEIASAAEKSASQ